MSSPRYLCSDLVALRTNSSETTVNLEEIWRDGATLDCEEEIANGADIGIQCGSVFLAGKITRVEQHEFGWRVEIEFSPLTPWNPEQFRPQHMLDAPERNVEC